MEKCCYGCGKKAKFKFKNGKKCCSKNSSSCSEIRKKNSTDKIGKIPKWKNGHPRGAKGKIPWNKGKTYEELYGLKKSLEIKEKQSKANIGKKTNHTEETRKKLSDIIKKRYKEGWMPKAGRCKKIKYISKFAGEVFLDGTWELKVAKFLDKSKIDWRRNKNKFNYFFENKNRFYTPDFYLVNSKSYLEVKGYETDKDKAKWKFFTHNLFVFRRKEINKIDKNKKIEWKVTQVVEEDSLLNC